MKSLGMHILSLPDQSLRIYNRMGVEEQDGILLSKLNFKSDETVHIQGIKGQTRRNMFAAREFPYVKVFEALTDGYYDLELDGYHYRFTIDNRKWTFEELKAAG